MKIIYFGTDVFLAAFEWLLTSEHEIMALYTYHNEEEYIRDEGIVALAKQHNIPVHYDRISSQEVVEIFSNGTCDLLLSAEYDAKIPVSAMENYRGMNIHNSLLPEGRGYFPIEMRLFKGYDYGGITIHKLAEKFDRGNIILQEKFSIAETENGWQIYQKCNRLSAIMLEKVLADFENYWQSAKPQGIGSYWDKPQLAELTITPAMTIREIEYIYRAFVRLTLIEWQGKIRRVAHIETVHSENWRVEGAVLGECILFQALDGVVKVYLQQK